MSNVGNVPTINNFVAIMLMLYYFWVMTDYVCYCFSTYVVSCLPLCLFSAFLANKRYTLNNSSILAFRVDAKVPNLESRQ